MATIETIDIGHYRIPLDVPLTDSTHGVMTAFEIVTEFDGNLAAGVPALRMLLDRMDRPGIRFPHQMKAAFLDLKIRTNPSKV